MSHYGKNFDFEIARYANLSPAEYVNSLKSRAQEFNQTQKKVKCGHCGAPVKGFNCRYCDYPV